MTTSTPTSSSPTSRYSCPSRSSFSTASPRTVRAGSTKCSPETRSSPAGTSVSAPPATSARCSTRLGISGVVADSFNGLGLRNCINSGLPSLPCAGVLDLFEEGDVAEVDWTQGAVRNVTTGATGQGQSDPASVAGHRECGRSGERLAQRGLPRAAKAEVRRHDERAERIGDRAACRMDREGRRCRCADDRRRAGTRTSCSTLSATSSRGCRSRPDGSCPNGCARRAARRCAP